MTHLDDVLGSVTAHPEAVVDPAGRALRSGFGPVWSVLFFLMAVSAWVFSGRAPGRTLRVGLGLFLGQLALNALWSGLFFAARSPRLAFAEIVVLWAAIAATLVAFARVSAVAAGLLVPYLLWVTYATALNGAIWQLNS